MTRLDSMRLGQGVAHFADYEAAFSGCHDPALAGWFVSDTGVWTVALIIDGELVFVRGIPSRGAAPDLPPESP